MIIVLKANGKREDVDTMKVRLFKTKDEAKKYYEDVSEVLKKYE